MKSLLNFIDKYSAAVSCALFLLCCCFIVSCDGKTPVSVDAQPSPVRPIDNGVFPVAPAGESVPRVESDAPTQCEILGIQARRVLEVRPGQVTLRVLANNVGEGTYVRIFNADTGKKLGDYDLGDITLFLEPGVYRLLIYTEARVNGRTIQCDGSLSFTIPENPTEHPDDKPTCDAENLRANAQREVDSCIWGGEFEIEAESCSYEVHCNACEEVNQFSYSTFGPNRTYYTERSCRDVTTGWVYKVTGNGPIARQFTCENKFDTYPGPKGVYTENVAIPGHGVVNACVFDEYPGSDDFQRQAIGADPRFRLVTTETEEECTGPSGIKVNGSVTFFNQGGTAQLWCGGVKKDSETIGVECGSEGSVNLHYEHPTAHTESTCELKVFQGVN